MGFWRTIWDALSGNYESSGRTALSNRQRVGKLRVEHDHGDGDGEFSLYHGDDFYEGGRRSPSGDYVVGTSDGHDDGRKKVPGRVILIDARTGEALFTAQLARANNAHVSDEGVVTVENWKAWGGPLSGDFVAFDKSGTRLWTKKYRANLYRSGMTADGRRVFVSTANSPHEAHGCKTFLLDVQTGGVLWTRDGFGAVRVQGNDIVIGLDGDIDRDGNEFFTLDSKGSPPPEYESAMQERRRLQEAEQDRRNRGKPWWTLPKVAEGLKDPDAELGELTRLLDELEARVQEVTAQERAKVERYRGEIAEGLGDPDSALRHWEQALKHDTKVGIRRRFDALKKAQG